MYKVGSTNTRIIKDIQAFLKVPITGTFGKDMLSSVIRFQQDNYIVADGIVGPETLNAMGILSSDLGSQTLLRTKRGLSIEKYHLPEEQFIHSHVPIINDYIVLENTRSWGNPFDTVDAWAKDTRGKIASEFVIGGPHFTNGDPIWNGHILQSFPDGCQGWHLGLTGSPYMSRHSVGITLCNFGSLSEDWQNVFSLTAHDSQRVMLKEPFRGKYQWHRYSDLQIYNLRKLIEYVAERDSIDIRKGIVQWIHDKGVQAFDYNQDAYDGKVKGLLLHCNISKDSGALFPQQEIMDMLLSL